MWTSFIFAAKTLVPSPIKPNILTMVVQQLFFVRNLFAILGFMKVDVRMFEQTIRNMHVREGYLLR